MKKFPFINEDAEGCRPFNESYEIFLNQREGKRFIQLESMTRAEFCIKSNVIGNAEPSWELSSIKTRENCPHDKYTLE